MGSLLLESGNINRTLSDSANGPALTINFFRTCPQLRTNDGDCKFPLRSKMNLGRIEGLEYVEMGNIKSTKMADMHIGLVSGCPSEISTKNSQKLVYFDISAQR